VATEGVAKRSALHVADGDMICLGDHLLDVRLHGKGAMQLAPDGENLVHACYPKNALHDSVGGEEPAEFITIAAIESFDVAGDDGLVGFERCMRDPKTKRASGASSFGPEPRCSKPNAQFLRPLISGLISAMAKRLFIALELPESCRKILVALNPHVNGLRWLPEEQLHATMSFIGRVSSAQEERLRETLARVRVPVFFLPIRGVGTFGGARPTTVWAGVGRGHPHLFALHKRIQDAVLQAGLEPDLKPFHPHITLGRANGVSGGTLLPFLRRNADVEFGLWKVTGFAMFSSILTTAGPIHTLEMRREF
jgi:RNA 2',3'-cyclic 3'-phosphodiesterase